MKYTSTYYGFALLGVFMLCSELFAVGALYCRPRWSEQDYKKMWIKEVNANTEIQDQVAVTHVNQIFINELSQQAEAVFIFPLPANAMITELVYWFNGQRYVANIRQREEAVEEYNRRIQQWLDPALLEYLGDNLFRLKIVPVEPNTEIRTEITYVELLEYNLGMCNYTFLLNTMDLSSKPLEKLTVNLVAQSQDAFKHFSSPSHFGNPSANLTKISGTEYHFFYGDEDFLPEKDLLIQFSTYQDDVRFRVLTYTPAPEDSFGTDSFYALWITPPDSVENEEVIPKDIVFTADVSSSMEGERLWQLKQALSAFLEMLSPDDRFNIITFSTFVESFKSDLVPATEEHITEASEYVDELYALGLTNIDAALSRSLTQSFGDSTLNNIVFLTDGQPTWGETEPDTILNNCSANNENQVRIFAFGIGDEVSRSLLNLIAEQNSGYATYIASDDSIALVVEEHFHRQSKPVLSDIEVDMGQLQHKDQYPKQFADLFWGYQLLQLGLYETGGLYTVTMEGNMRNDFVSYEQNVLFPDTTGGHRFIPRLWAKAKIDHLMDMIQIYGEEQELIDQIVELSLRFEILTSYTAFYSDPIDDDPDPTSINANQKCPDEFHLYQNYPNPFNPITRIRFDLPNHESLYQVRIQVFDLLGRLIITLVDGIKKPGRHFVVWNGKDAAGTPVPSGVYIYTIHAGKFSQSGKMLLIK